MRPSPDGQERPAPPRGEGGHLVLRLEADGGVPSSARGGPWLCPPSTGLLSPLQSRQPFPGEQTLSTCWLHTGRPRQRRRPHVWLAGGFRPHSPALGPALALSAAHRSALPAAPSAGFPSYTRGQAVPPALGLGVAAQPPSSAPAGLLPPSATSQVPPPLLRAPQRVPRPHRLTGGRHCRVPGTWPFRQSVPETPSLPTPHGHALCQHLLEQHPFPDLNLSLRLPQRSPRPGGLQQGWSGGRVTPSVRALGVVPASPGASWLVATSLSLRGFFPCPSCVCSLVRTLVMSREGPGSQDEPVLASRTCSGLRLSWILG